MGDLPEKHELMEEAREALAKTLGPTEVLALALGAIVGWGCFMLPGITFLPNAGPLGTIIAFFIGAFFQCIVALGYSFLIKPYPVAGGAFVYAYAGFGSKGAFICGWALVLGYVPLFTVDTPHAYSYFHISGVHYFTVSCVLAPPLFVLYLDMLVRHCRRSCPGTAEEKELAVLLRCGGLGYGPRMFLAAACTAAALCIPLLCVSRFQLIFALLLGAFTKLSLPGGGRPGKRLILGAGILLLCLIPLYIGLTVARAHDVAYLNGIFEMKDPGTPIFFTQPYMYVANNFDNFNCLVRELPAGGHTLGLRMLFPLWALTGLKFLFPQLVSFPLYVTKTELTTVTLFYDAYYDFGLLGVALLGLLLGAAYGIFLKKTGLFQRERPLGIRGTGLCLIYAQLAFYLLFSFFTTWFSNPTTWFYLAVSLVICIYIGKEDPR